MGFLAMLTVLWVVLTSRPVSQNNRKSTTDLQEKTLVVKVINELKSICRQRLFEKLAPGSFIIKLVTLGLLGRNSCQHSCPTKDGVQSS